MKRIFLLLALALFFSPAHLVYATKPTAPTSLDQETPVSMARPLLPEGQHTKPTPQSLSRKGISVKDTVYGVMRTHRAIRIQQENREALRHEVNRAKAGFGPRIDITNSGGWGLLSDQTSRATGFDDRMYAQANLSAKLVQPIWDGFQTRSRVRSAQSSLEAQEERVFDILTSLSLDGIVAHINLVRCRTLLQLAKDNVNIHEQILSLAKDRADLGADTFADSSQASSRHQRALSSLEEQKDALRVAETSYTRLTGIPASQVFLAAPMPPLLFKKTSDIFALAKEYNPKLAAYRKDIRAARANRELAVGAFSPTLNLEAGPNYTNKAGSRDRWTYSFDILLALHWNIFNSGADLEGYKSANARLRQTRQTYYNAADDIHEEINNTWSNYIAAQQQFTHYSKAIEFNKFTLKAYHEQFQLGRRTLLDVLDSENELYSSSIQAETARSNILIGAYRLIALTGTMLPKMKINIEHIKKAPPIDPEDKREVFEKGWFN